MSQYEFTRSHCDEWRQTPNRNPKTNRKINPEAEFGVYKELERQCDPKEKKAIKQVKEQVKEQSNKQSNKRTTLTQRSLSLSPYRAASPSPIVSPNMYSKNSNSKKKNNNSFNVNDHSGVHLVAQITIIRNPILDILQDVKACIHKYCNSEKNIQEIEGKIKNLLEIITENIDAMKSTKDAKKTIKKIDEEIEKQNLKNYAECVMKNCGSKYLPIIKKIYDIKIMIIKEIREKLDEKLEQGKLNKTDVNIINDIIDLFLKRLTILKHTLEQNVKNTTKIKTTDIIFLAPLISQVMGKIILFLANL